MSANASWTPFLSRTQEDGRFVVPGGTARALRLRPNEIIEFQLAGHIWLVGVRRNGLSRSIAARIPKHLRALLGIAPGTVIEGGLRRRHRRGGR